MSGSRLVQETDTVGAPLGSISRSRTGLSKRELMDILAFTQLSLSELATVLPISERQLARYAEEHVLRKDISAQLLLILTLFKRGYEVFQRERFHQWIRTENPAMDYQRPLDLLDTPIGIQLIHTIMGRLEHGVFS